MAGESVLKAVVFDCDGVLVDTEPLHYKAFQEVLNPRGISFGYEEYLRDYIGFDDRDAFIEAHRAIGRSLGPDELSSLIEAKAAALREIIERGVRSFPGVAELVRELEARSIPLAVASGALRHEVEGFLKALGLRDAFPVIVAADDVEKSKPDPETYLASLRLLQQRMGADLLEPGRCVAIEDTPTGIQAARAAGMLVIGVTNSFPAERLKEADHVVKSLADVNIERLIELAKEAR